jgi:hypothetical protein
MNMPIIMKQDRIQLPRLATDAARVVVARNGVFVERRGPMFSTSIRMRPTDLQLDDHSQYCTLSCGRLPAPLHRVMLSFFLHAHRIHGGEAALVLLFHPGNRQYLWHCPEQTVDMHQRHDGWYVDDVIEFNNPLDLPEGYLHLGDAHLHPHSPHPSAMDKRDDQDGLHIIVGNITRAPEYHIDFVMDGVRFPLTAEQFFADPATRPGSRAPRLWLEQIRIRAHGHAKADRNGERSEGVRGDEA